MKFTTIFAAAAAIFAGFVAASPVAAPNAVAIASPEAAGTELVTRSRKVEEECYGILVDLDVKVAACNDKYSKRCSSGNCGYSDLKAYQLELSVLINAAVALLKAKIFVGLTFVNIKLFIDICVKILVSINVTLNLICKGFGLLGFLLVRLVLDLCVDLSVSLKALIAVLAICIPDILVKIQVNLGGLIGALLCLVCSLLNIIL